MIIAIGNYIGRKPNNSLRRYWTNRIEAYELWKITGAGNLVGLKRGDILTVGGTAGSYTFQVPNEAGYIAADIDKVWFDQVDAQRTATEAEMVGFDFSRTIVKYANTSPYAIEYIMILASTPATAQENKMRDDFDLSIWWDNTLSIHGNVKQNRGAGQSFWDIHAQNLIARMIAASETPTAERQLNITTTIRALKAASLFHTRFDRFVVYRAHGVASAVMNWIKNANNAAGVANGGTLTFTADLGFHSDGIKSYLRSNYIPSTGAILMTQNNASHGIKNSGTIIGGNHGYGAIGAAAALVFIQGGAQYNRCNGTAYAGGQVIAAGYNQLSRSSATEFKQHRAAGELTIASNSTGLVERELYSLVVNEAGTPNYWCGVAEYIEMEWQGASISFAEFQTLSTIMNAYIAAL